MRNLAPEAVGFYLKLGAEVDSDRFEEDVRVLAEGFAERGGRQEPSDADADAAGQMAVTRKMVFEGPALAALAAFDGGLWIRSS
jgi:hypothetical protein